MKRGFCSMKVKGRVKHYLNFLLAFGVLCLMPAAVQANVAFEHFTTYKRTERTPDLMTEDLNGDGVSDLTLITSLGIAVRLGLGDGSFGASTYYNGGYYPMRLITADFNNDGLRDIATTNSNQTITILIGNGDGTFQAGVTAGNTSTPARSLTSADFDNDGNADIVVGNYSFSYPPALQFFYGIGDGTFYDFPSISDPKPMPTALHTADFNNDGNADLAVAYPWAGEIGVFLGKGDGTFHDRTGHNRGAFHIRNNIFSIEDINFDGAPDIITMPSYSKYDGVGFIRVLMNDGTGTFTEVDSPNGVPIINTSMNTADFNCDGNPDIAVSGNDTLYSINNLSIYVGNGDGTFAYAVSYTDPPSDSIYTGKATIAVDDLNGDGKFDIVIQNERSTDINVYLNTGPGCGPASPGDLVEVVKEMHINGLISGPGSHGTAKSLTAKLEAAQAALDLDPPDYATAITALNDFISGVSAQSGKHIDPDAAAQLISYAQGFIAQYSIM